jgi:D-glycero-D-manno-heptose 1,7-bisphosphate phosphatase
VLKQAVFLVGGRGTRLGAMTADMPKPCLEVAGRPFLSYLIDSAVRHGLTDIVLLAGYRADVVEKLCGTQRLPESGDARISIVTEPQAAGTAGALIHAGGRLDDTFLLANGDSFFDFNWLDLLTIPAAGDWEGRIALRQVADGSRYGRVATDGERVTSFEGTPRPGPALINGGVYVLRRSVLDRIRSTPASLETDVLPALAAQGRLYGRAYEGAFVDIGVPADFAAAGAVMSQALRRPAAFLDRDGVLNVDHGYVYRPDQIEWIPGAKATVKRLNDAGYLVFIITNQAGVARGYYSEQHVRDLHAWMAQELQAVGAHVDAFQYCPYHPEGTVADYRRASEYRKPATGMLMECARRWPVDMSRSFLIGDKELDMETAAAAGIPGYLFAGPDLLDFTEGLGLPGRGTRPTSP